MILFYEKETGKIIGVVEGRVHDSTHLNMWVGDKEHIGRIIVIDINVQLLLESCKSVCDEYRLDLTTNELVKA